MEYEKCKICKHGTTCSHPTGLGPEGECPIYGDEEEEKECWAEVVNGYSKDLIYCGAKITVSCDGNCKKAWGINSRPRDEEGGMILDELLGEAPENPGTIECASCKPLEPSPKMNKWCIRECERSKMEDRK